MQAVIDILDILVWPITVLLLAFGFRSQLSALLARVSRIGYDGFSVRFQRLLGPAEQALSAERSGEVQAERQPREARLQRLAEQAPRAAILEAWADLTEVLSPVSDGGDTAVPAIKRHTMAADDSAAIRALADIRDDALATDDREVTHDMASRYVRLACRARRRIETGVA